METIEERVAKGAALLDEKRPGWAARINRDTLRISSRCGCILGQEFGSYDAGEMGLFAGTFESSAEHGFVAWAEDEADGDLDGEYGDLERAWLAEIDKRTNAQGA